MLYGITEDKLTTMREVEVGDHFILNGHADIWVMIEVLGEKHILNTETYIASKVVDYWLDNKVYKIRVPK